MKFKHYGLLALSVALIVGVLIYGAGLPHRKEIKSLTVTAKYAARAELTEFEKTKRYNPRVEMIVNPNVLDGAIVGFKSDLPMAAQEKCTDCEITSNGFTIAAYKKTESGFYLVTVNELGSIDDRSVP